MGGRGASGGVSKEWLTASQGYQEWQSFRFNNPRSYAPDRIEQLARDFNQTNKKLMRAAVEKSHFLKFNDNSNNAYYSHSLPDGAGTYSVTIQGTANGGMDIKIGGVVLTATAGRGWLSKQEDYKVFSSHAEAARYADKIIRKRRKHDKL